MEANKRRLILISLCALAAAVILGIALFFIFRGETGEQEDDPGNVDAQQTMPGNNDDVQPTPGKGGNQHDISNPVYPTAYVPYDMADGMYRLVGGEAYVNGEGKACYSTKTNELIYWAFGSNGLFRSSVDFEGADKSLHSILTAIGNGSMFNVESGKITAIYIFPSTTEDTKKDLSALPKEAVKDIDVVIAINPSTSGEAGMATATNTGLLLPSYLTSFKVFLDGDYVLENSERTPTFLTGGGNGLIVINTAAGEGASARIFADFGDDGYRAFKITLLRDGTIEIIYETTVEAASQGGNRPGGQGGGSSMTGAPVPDGVYVWSNGRLRCADTGVILMKNESLGWMIINGENRNLIDDQSVIDTLGALSETDAVEIKDGKVAEIIKDGSVNSGGGSQGGGGQGGGSSMTGAPVPDGVYVWSNGRLRCADTGVILMKNESLGWMILNGENRNLIDDQSVIDSLNALAETDAVEIKDGKVAEIIKDGSVSGDGGSGGSGGGQGGGSAMTGAPVPDGEYKLTSSGTSFRCADTGVILMKNESLGWMIINGENRNLVEDETVIEKLEEAMASKKGVQITNGEFVKFVEGSSSGGGGGSSGGNGGGGSGSRPGGGGSGGGSGNGGNSNPGGGGGGGGSTSVTIPAGEYTLRGTVFTGDNGYRLVYANTNQYTGWILQKDNGTGSYDKVGNVTDTSVTSILNQAKDAGKNITVDADGNVKINEDSSGGNQGGGTVTLSIPEGTWEVKNTEAPATIGLTGSSLVASPISFLVNQSYALAPPIVIYAGDDPEYYLQGQEDIESYSLKFRDGAWKLFENNEDKGAVNASGEAGAFLNNVSAEGWNSGTFTYDSNKFTPTDNSSGKEIVKGVYTVCETTGGNQTFQYLSNGVIAMRYAKNTADGTSSWSVKFVGDTAYKPIEGYVANADDVLDALKARFGTSLSGLVGNRYYFDGDQFVRPGVGSDVSRLTGKYTVMQNGTGSKIVHEYDGGEVTITNRSGTYTVTGGYGDERDDDLIDALKAFLSEIGLSWGGLVERYGNSAYYDGFRFGYSNLGDDEPGIVEDGIYKLVANDVDGVSGATMKDDAKAKATAKNENGSVTLVMSNENNWYIYANDSYNYISDEDVQDALRDLYNKTIDQVVIWNNTTFRIADGTYTIRPTALPTTGQTYAGLYYDSKTGKVEYRLTNGGELKITYVNPRSETGDLLSNGCSDGDKVTFVNHVITLITDANDIELWPNGPDGKCECSPDCTCQGNLHCEMGRCHCLDCPGNEAPATLEQLEGAYTYDNGVFTREDGGVTLTQVDGVWKVTAGEMTRDVDEDTAAVLNTKAEGLIFETGKKYELTGAGWTEAPVTYEVPNGEYTNIAFTSTNFKTVLEGPTVPDSGVKYYIRQATRGTWALYKGQTKEADIVGTALIAALNQAVVDGLEIGDTLVFVNDTFAVEKGSGTQPPQTTAQEVPEGIYTVQKKTTTQGSSYQYLLNADFALRYVQGSGWSVSFDGGNTYAVITESNVTNYEELMGALNATFNTTGAGLRNATENAQYEFDGTAFTLKDTGGGDDNTGCQCTGEKDCNCGESCECDACKTGGGDTGGGEQTQAEKIEGKTFIVTAISNSNRLVSGDIHIRYYQNAYGINFNGGNTFENLDPDIVTALQAALNGRALKDLTAGDQLTFSNGSFTYTSVSSGGEPETPDPGCQCPDCEEGTCTCDGSCTDGDCECDGCKPDEGGGDSDVDGIYEGTYIFTVNGNKKSLSNGTVTISYTQSGSTGSYSVTGGTSDELDTKLTEALQKCFDDGGSSLRWGTLNDGATFKYENGVFTLLSNPAPPSNSDPEVADTPTGDVIDGEPGSELEPTDPETDTPDNDIDTDTDKKDAIIPEDDEDDTEESGTDGDDTDDNDASDGDTDEDASEDNGEDEDADESED